MIAGVLLILVLPFCLGIALLCVIWDGFPVLYREKRCGLHKKEFTIWKFRTMYTKQPDTGMRCHKTPKDPRINRLGYILRRFSIDELPQLFNVAKGEMALVGPRPIIKEETLLYGKYSRLLHSVKPGMTGLWQVSGRNLTTYHRRIAINRYYVKHRSWKLDLWILWNTIGPVISGRGAF